MRLHARLATALVAVLTMTACASSAPPAIGLPPPLPAALLQSCPPPGPAPGAEVDAVAVALMELYALYGQCAALHLELVHALEGGR